MTTLGSGGMAEKDWHKMPVRLTPEHLMKADYLASKWGMSRTEAIRECIDAMFAREIAQGWKDAQG